MDLFLNDYLLAIYRDTSEAYKALTAGIKDELEYRRFSFSYLLNNLDVENTDQYLELVERFEKLRMEYFDFFKDVPTLLRELRKKYTLVVITNGPEFSQIPKVHKVKMEDHVDHVIIGGQEPEEKPHLSIFKKALDLADCGAGEVIHVGDSLGSDIAGAENAGIKSFWINHKLSSFTEGCKEADFASHTILDLPQALS